MSKSKKTEAEIKKYLGMIRDLKKSRMLVVGDIMLDEYVWGSASRISPEAPVPVVEIKSRTFNAGGAANTLSNIISLGAEATLMGVIGNDQNGGLLKKILVESGIGTKHIITDRQRPTTYKVRILAQGQQVMRADQEDTNPVNDAVTSKLIRRIDKIAGEIDGIAISDYNKGVIGPRLMSRLINLSKEKGKILVADLKPQNAEWFKGATMVTPNRLEASQISGINITDNQTLYDAGKAIQARMGIAYVLITLGEGGMALFAEGKSMTQIPAVSTQVYDVTGAGDTVLATVAASLSLGHKIQDAVRLANFAAAIVVRKRGTATVSAAELADFIKRKTL
jgi:D-beta-D-heptose 7-phosphate kinase/D-beta-D-heptose 1-phosphate adenosyltransferase